MVGKCQHTSAQFPETFELEVQGPASFSVAPADRVGARNLPSQQLPVGRNRLTEIDAVRAKPEKFGFRALSRLMVWLVHKLVF